MQESCETSVFHLKGMQLMTHYSIFIVAPVV